MPKLTPEQIAILRAAGRNRIVARMQVLMGEGRLAASAVVARGMHLLKAAGEEEKPRAMRSASR